MFEKKFYMNLCITNAKKGVTNDEGGPFGAVIVKEGLIVGVGNNRVLVDNDPTAHGEMVAIRNACKNLGTFDLSGCELYTSAEPCPMCLSAIMWSNIKKVYYGCSVEDTDKIGFRDGFIYDWLENRDTKVLDLEQLERDSAIEAFNLWREKENKTQY